MFTHYQLLTDPERRRKFDNLGITEEGNRQRPDNSHFHMPDPLEDLFTGNFKFHYQNRDISFFHKMSITYRSVKLCYLVPLEKSATKQATILDLGELKKIILSFKKLFLGYFLIYLIGEFVTELFFVKRIYK